MLPSSSIKLVTPATYLTSLPSTTNQLACEPLEFNADGECTNKNGIERLAEEPIIQTEELRRFNVIQKTLGDFLPNVVVDTIINPYARDIVFDKTDEKQICAILSSRQPKEISELFALACMKGKFLYLNSLLRKITLERFEKLDFSGVDFSYLNLTGIQLMGVNLTDANMEGTILIQAYLKNATLIRANMNRAILSNAKLSGSDLTDASMVKATLEAAEADDTNLTRTKLQGANLNFASICRAKWDGADLTGVNLSGARTSLGHHSIQL